MSTPQLFTHACQSNRNGEVLSTWPCHRCKKKHGCYSPFGEDEWAACSEPHILRECVTLLRMPFESRRIAVAVGRELFSSCEDIWFWKAVECGEELAEGKLSWQKSVEIEKALRAAIPPVEARRDEWLQTALACVAIAPLTYFGAFERTSSRRIGDIYRDQIPNPFVQLEWNPEWFTSTVRQLASHIYESREFSAMQILADALMDAGCDHQLIQEHCRSTKPHARGCWVVDAILGKS